jgi:hypothetical protein
MGRMADKWQVFIAHQMNLGNRMAGAAWWYFFSKFTEFFDTFFFLARKKFDNVSTLHVVHHGIMPFFAWQACRFVPGEVPSIRHAWTKYRARSTRKHVPRFKGHCAESCVKNQIRSKLNYHKFL